MKLKNVVLRNNWYWASSEILFYSRLIEIRLNLLVFFSFFFHFIHIDFQESYLVYYGTCFFKILKISMITYSSFLDSSTLESVFKFWASCFTEHDCFILMKQSFWCFQFMSLIGNFLSEQCCLISFFTMFSGLR